MPRADISSQTLQNHLRRALLRTLAAAGTFAVVDVRDIVLHGDGVKLAALHAELTADTSGGADLFDCLTERFGVTCHLMLCLIRNQLDQ